MPDVKTIVGVVMACIVTMVLQGWRHDAELATVEQEHAEEREAAANRVATANLRAANALQRAIEIDNRRKADQAASENRHFKELQDAQKSSTDLQRGVASGDVRLSVRATCPARAGTSPAGRAAPTAAARLDDGAGRADVHPADGADLIALFAEANGVATRLNALQEWVRIEVGADAETPAP
jgi:hypothetical protein